MMVHLERKDTKTLLDSASEYATLDVVGRITTPRDSVGESCRIYDDMVGQWYIFGGHCLHFAAIRADSFDSAHDIYLTEYVTSDDEYDEFTENGTYASDGSYYSEITLSYIMGIELGLSDYRVSVELLAD